ncbi:Twinfilin-1 [Tilletia horrida]|nr:Twinfilin-1 [Tilletia horrida]
MPPAAPRVSDSLISLFEATTSSTEAKPEVRAILVQSEENNTLLTNTATKSASDSDSSDFHPHLRALLANEPNRSAYILYRLDTTAAAGSWEWILCCYQPPAAPVREKMRYVQTRTAILGALKEFNFLDTIYGQTPGEFIFPTKLRNARKVDYQNPNVGLQGRSAAQAAGASTGGVRRNFGQIGTISTGSASGGLKAVAPTSTAAASATSPTSRPFAGAAPTPFANPNAAAAKKATPPEEEATTPAPAAEEAETAPDTTPAEDSAPVQRQVVTSTSPPATSPTAPRPFAGAIPTPFANPNAAVKKTTLPAEEETDAPTADAAETAPAQDITEEIATEKTAAPSSAEEAPPSSEPAAPEAEAEEQAREAPVTATSEIPEPETAPVAAAEEDVAEPANNDEGEEDGFVPKALQDSRVPSPVHVGHVAETPHLETVDERLATRFAQSATIENAHDGTVDAPPQPDTDPASEEPPVSASQEPEAAEADAQMVEVSVPPTPLPERPSEPVAAILEDAQPPAPEEDAAPLDTSDGVIAATVPPEEQTEIKAADPVVEESLPLPTAVAPHTPSAGSDTQSLIVEPPTPAPARSAPEVDPEAVSEALAQDAAQEAPVEAEEAPSTPLAAPTSATSVPPPFPAAAPPPAPAPTSAQPAVVDAPTPAGATEAPSSNRESDSLLTEQEATRAEVDRATAAERASAVAAAAATGGKGKAGHKVVSFEWEEEVLPALSVLPIRASGPSEFNFVLLSLNLTPGEERIELAAPPRFLPAAEVGHALDQEGGPRYAFYRMEGQPVFADDEEPTAEEGDEAVSPVKTRRSSSSPVAMTGGGLLFIYSCPTTSTIRERMLYSSNLHSFLFLAEQRVGGLKVQKRVETSDPIELTASYLSESLASVRGPAESSGNEPIANDSTAAAPTAGPGGGEVPSGPLLGTVPFGRPRPPRSARR